MPLVANARVIKVRRTPKWSPPLRLRGHENGPRRRVPGELPGIQPSAANYRAQNLDCVDQTRSPPTITQPRPASTLVAANIFLFGTRCCAPSRAQHRKKGDANLFRKRFASP